jgi:oligoendopeptidase F
MPAPLPRSKVKQNQTWNAETVFDSPEAFEAEAQSILKSLPSIKKFQGHLADDPSTFIKAMKAIDKLSKRASKLQIYATMSSAVNSRDQQAAAMYGKAMSLMAQIDAATSFLDP